MLAKKYRLSRSSEVLEVLKKGRFVGGGMVGIKYKFQSLEVSKFQSDKEQEPFRAGDNHFEHVNEVIVREIPNGDLQTVGNSRGSEQPLELERKVEDFSRALQGGRNGDNSRVTVIVSKKVFKKAVDRNRAKRLVRESVRLLWSGIKPGYDLVFLVQSGIADKKQQEVETEVSLLLKKAGLLKDI